MRDARAGFGTRLLVWLCVLLLGLGLLVTLRVGAPPTLTLEAGLPAIGAERLAELYCLARRRLNSIRVLPQTHKLLGIR